MIKKLILTILFFALYPLGLNAQIIDSNFYNWRIYESFSKDSMEKKCYMVNNPVKSETDHNNRKLPYIAITRYQNRRFEEVSIYSGYEYKNSSNILVAIDNIKFRFVTNKDMAWTKTKKEDAILIQKMLTSSQIKVRSDSAIGTFAIDEYSLKGIAKAYKRLKRICN